MYEYLSCNVSNNAENMLLKDLEIICNNDVKNIPAKIMINDNLFETNFILKECPILLNRARKINRLAEDIPLESTTIEFDINRGRIHILEILSACRCNLMLSHTTVEMDFYTQLLKNLDLFLSSITSIREYNDRVLNKLIQCNESSFSQYLHLYFDIQWISLTIYYICKTNNDLIYKKLEDILLDLTFLAKFIFAKQGLNSSPFVCCCMEMLWCGIEHFVTKLSGSQKEFWNIYNKIINNYDHVFSLWLLKHIALSNKNLIDNCTLIEMKLKIITKVENSDHNLLQILKIIKPLLNDMWLKNAKIDPYLLLWEYFFKQLNEFDVEIPSKMIDFIEFNNSVNEYSNLYQLFINMLNIHLKNHPTHWSKLKGRVYSRLPAHKIAEFSDKGVLNISLFFLELININFEELSKKLLELLENVSRKNLELLCMIYMSLISKHIMNEKDISHICKPICEILENASKNRDLFGVIKCFIEGFEYILNTSHNYNLKQHKFFDTWLSKFIISCQYTDLCYFINILIWTAERVSNSDDFYEWIFAYSKYVLPPIKQIITTQNVPPQCGKLIGIMLKNTMSDKTQLIEYFTNYAISPKIVNQFLCTILERYPEIKVVPSNYENVIVQLWINCTISNTDVNDEVIRKILKLDLFSVLNFNNLQKDSLQSLFKAINNTQDMPVYKLKSLCDSIFGHIDNFIKHILNQFPNDFNISHMYKCVGHLYQYCSTLIYDKSKSSCLLSRLTSTMLLTTDILMGKPPKNSIQKAIESNYSIFVEGLFRLDYANDPFIERTLKDFIVKYIPHFPTIQSPILACFHNENIACFTLDKINRHFLIYSAKCSEENTFKALKILHVAIENCINENIIKLIVKIAFPGILETIMFNANKIVAIELVKMLVLSDWYVKINDEMKNSLQFVMEKHLSFNANNFFQLVMVLIKLIPADIKSFLPNIKSQITIVEKMRGVGYDKTLRNGLYKIESSLSINV